MSGDNESLEWNRVKKQLHAELGDDVFTSWFARIDFEEFQDGTVRLSVPTQFLKQWIQKHYQNQILGFWKRECETVQNIELSVRGAVRSVAVALTPNTQSRRAAVQKIAQTAKSPPKADDVLSKYITDAMDGSVLDPRSSFGSFLESASNRTALTAVKNVVLKKDDLFNPLFIQAATGMGKTHLLQAAAASIRRNGKKALYLTAEHFMYRFVVALNSRAASTLRHVLNSIDYLVVDDIQFLHEKKARTEFSHMLNLMLDEGRQVIVASDRLPLELDFDERTRSRLSGGLVVQLGESDFGLRTDILVSQVAEIRKSYPSFDVSEDVLRYVASSVKSTIRGLGGAMNRFLAFHQLMGRVPTYAEAEETIKDLIAVEEAQPIKIAVIQRIVSRHYEIARSDMLSRRRARVVVLPRQIAMYLAKEMTPRSLPEIGRRFGNRDHTTVLHAHRKISRMLPDDPTFSRELESLKEMIRAAK
ncbi:chromosomal replication initiator protein DnaA [Roseibium sp. Sym1]|uniref:chromosomal replication initiator protein DnaA n=1 Tax=Roseibium sp. Sym1 TaxID=3016006 RepID=UPI0022B443BF|nr:chromosomal replication initiator protein DnaA [Roseibium sp. Sym1]